MRFDEEPRMDQTLIRLMFTMARGCVPDHLRGKIDPEDIVQDALLKLHQANGALEGRTEGERCAYSREVFVTTLADHIRHFDRSKRHATLERSLEAALDESSARIELWLISGHSSPSTRAARNEQLRRLADAIAELPDDQRRAVELHHLQKMSLIETARLMQKSPQSVAGLIRRGTATLRQLLAGDDTP
jgi:RNA polymerase sigma-70 factor (ECF subfamily)